MPTPPVQPGLILKPAGFHVPESNPIPNVIYTRRRNTVRKHLKDFQKSDKKDEYTGSGIPKYALESAVPYHAEKRRERKTTKK